MNGPLKFLKKVQSTSSSSIEFALVLYQYCDRFVQLCSTYPESPMSGPREPALHQPWQIGWVGTCGSVKVRVDWTSETTTGGLHQPWPGSTTCCVIKILSSTSLLFRYFCDHCPLMLSRQICNQQFHSMIHCTHGSRTLSTVIVFEVGQPVVSRTYPNQKKFRIPPASGPTSITPSPNPSRMWQNVYNASCSSFLYLIWHLKARKSLPMEDGSDDRLCIGDEPTISLGIWQPHLRLRQPQLNIHKAVCKRLQIY